MEGDVLVVGESVVDIVQTEGGGSVEYAGGSAANVAVALARLGRPVRLATSYGADRHGELIAAHLAAAGVILAADPHAVPRTSTAVATIGSDGGASYVFDFEWRLNPVAEVPPPLVVHACSLGAVLLPGADEVLTLLTRLREQATISYDVNARPAITGIGPDLVARVERMARVADVVKASDEDLEALYPHLELMVAARRLFTLGPAAVVVTRGGSGATWVGSTGAVESASLPVTVADTIGAGDTFAAALIDALWERGLLGADSRELLRSLGSDEVANVLAHAARAAAVTVSRPGADPPYRSELAPDYR